MERPGILTKVRIKMDEFTPPGVTLPFDDFIGPVLDECAKKVAMVAPLHLLVPVSMVCNTTKRKIDTNVATITIASTHGFIAGQRVTISGIVEAHYNGDFTLTAVTATTISYALVHANEVETNDTGGIVTFKTYFADNKAYIPKPSSFLRLYEMRFPAWTKTVREVVKMGTPEYDIQNNQYTAAGIGRPVVILQTTSPTGGAFGEYLVCAKVETASVPSASFVKIPIPEELPDQLIDSLTWLAASDMLIIAGYADRAKLTMDQYANSLSLIAQS